MVFDRFAEGAEDNTVLRQLFLVGGGDRNTVEHSVHRHIAQPFLFTERNSQLVEGFKQLGINLIQAGLLVLLLRGGVVNDVLVVDRGMAQCRPVRLLQGQPVPEGFQPEVEQKSGLLLLL